MLAALLRFLGFRREEEAPPAPPGPVPVHVVGEAAPAASLVSAALLRRLGAAEPERWAPILSAACARHGITSPRALAAFLANILHETGNLRRLVENLSYSPERICQVWPSRFPTVEAARPFAYQPELLANKVYGGRLGNTQPGDGWRFRGRGGLQTTGRTNYANFASALGVPLDDRLLERLETPEGAAESAAHYWRLRGCGPIAERGDIRTVRAMINGGAVGLAEVEALHRRALEAMGEAALAA